MISATVLNMILQKECKYWRQRPQTEYVKGIVYGIKLARQKAEHMHRTRVEEARIIQPIGIRNGLARQFFRAIFQTHYYLSKSETRYAKAKLRTVLDRYKINAKNE